MAENREKLLKGREVYLCTWFQRDLGPSRWGRHDDGDKNISFWNSSRGEMYQGFSRIQKAKTRVGSVLGSTS